MFLKYNNYCSKDTSLPLLSMSLLSNVYWIACGIGGFGTDLSKSSNTGIDARFAVSLICTRPNKLEKFEHKYDVTIIKGTHVINL